MVRVECHVQREAGKVAPALRHRLADAMAGAAPWPVVLTGGVGSGKTCAALTVADYAMSARYFTTETLCEDLIDVQQGRITDGSGQMTTRRWWQRIGEVALVVLDELGTREHVSDHHYATVKRLLDVRQGMPLILIANLPISGPVGQPSIRAVYDDRIASRMAAGTVMRVEGADRRLTA